MAGEVTAQGARVPVAPVAQGAVPLAEVVRGDLVESVHLGHLVVLGPDGDVQLALGDPATTIWPRSSVKPLQALAMLRSGLDLPAPLLALAAASHSGAPEHLAGVREILAGAGLDESALRNTPDLPLGRAEARTWQEAGHGPARIAQNCSGKHAAMLATCVAAGWDTATYLDPAHPLQGAVRAAVVALTGDDDPHMTVDGCGAPLFSTSVLGLARSFGRLAGAGSRSTPGADADAARVARAMAAHPEMVAGRGREDTLVMTAVPGAIAKIGADGVCAAGLPDGSAVAFKILDGGDRPRPAILAAALRAAGAAEVAGADLAALDAVGVTSVLGGGVPVGAVRPAFPVAAA
ncbi:asparaginase [Krasilnikoviella flava]|uniref:Asparaginase n=1 Tax=Krasilnikoviella flava TaxID=526729 RepID=A0A1T5IM62_9MICO|nr:asparaginase [Krasilnikoviella flava]SKC40225.1 asparaginase [Krasilnikoviella flava]